MFRALRINSLSVKDLEQSTHLAGLDVHVDSSEGRVGAGSGHQADGAGTGTQELGDDRHYSSCLGH